MRIILFSDVHGNSIALDAVLSDVKKFGKIDAYWILGDVIGIGPDPVGVLDRLYKLPNASFVRGNTDRYVLHGVRPKPSRRETVLQPELIKQMKQIAASFAWTQGAVTAAGWLPWLSKFPLEQRLTLPDGTRVLGAHASPGSDSGPGIHPKLALSFLRVLIADCEADLLFVGHTHFPFETTVDNIHIVNVGSVSNPLPPDLRACYVVLEADESGYQVQYQRVDYNRDAVIAALDRVQHPATEYITRTMYGQHKPAWLK